MTICTSVPRGKIGVQSLCLSPIGHDTVSLLRQIFPLATTTKATGSHHQVMRFPHLHSHELDWRVLTCLHQLLNAHGTLSFSLNFIIIAEVFVIELHYHCRGDMLIYHNYFMGPLHCELRRSPMGMGSCHNPPHEILQLCTIIIYSCRIPTSRFMYHIGPQLQIYQFLDLLLLLLQATNMIQ